MVNQTTMEELRKVIYELTGNYYPNERLLLLAKKLSTFLEAENNAKDLKSKVEELLKNKQLSKELLNIITVPETRFFREKIQLDIFMNKIVPTIKSRPIRVASYACATGEEVYALSMMFEKAMIPYQIMGFDINETYLEKARIGKYPKRELFDIPSEYQQFVNIKESCIEIKDVLKKNVQFKTLNLITNEHFLPYREVFDLAFCRNALIYFNDESKLKAIKNIVYTMKEEGYFVVSMTEVLNKVHTSFFETLKIENIFFYKKKKN